MSIRFLAPLIAAAAVFLAGCATPPQPPISLSKEAVGAKNARIGVAMVAVPKVDTHFPGAGCLLCMAFASASNSAITTQVRTLTPEDLPKLKQDAAERLRKKGTEVVVIDEDLKLDAFPDVSKAEPGKARKDFSSLKTRYKLDRLLVLQIEMLGVIRNYSAYVPTSDPKGVVTGTAYIVNLQTGALEWYQPIDVQKSAEGKWDETPKYPGLTNAYFQAIELGKDGFLKPLSE
jgi:hypothetical protein